MARALASSGTPVGFFEAGDLAETTMYENWRELARNWPRSLPMLDGYSGIDGWVGLVQIVMVQAMPLWLLIALEASRPNIVVAAALLQLQCALLATRLGVLVGTRRAYSRVPWTYWLSPLLDMAAVVAIVCSALRPRHVWRGRVLVRERV